MAVSTVTPAQIIPTARTAAPNAASSTANPNFPSTVVTWTLPGFPSQPQVQSTQSFSTTKGEVFSDFVSGTLVPMPGQLPTGPATYALVEGSPSID